LTQSLKDQKSSKTPMIADNCEPLPPLARGAFDPSSNQPLPAFVNSPCEHVPPDNDLSNGGQSVMLAGMSETVKFMHRGAGTITPALLKSVHKKLPFLKLKFTELDNPAFPHLPDQLEFLADVVEDFAEGVEEDLPYATAAAAVFALLYAHRQFDLIPDAAAGVGLADDSAVVRAVLVEHEKVLAAYAERHKMKWDAITVKP
jgi:uncharacterized membrane protein YkvA (DUF1232 family)